MEIIKEYEPQFNGRIRWVSEKDSGLYDAMNKGFRMATGEVIGIINSDDLIAEPTAIEDVVRCFESNNSIDAVYIMSLKMIHLKSFDIGNRVTNGLLLKDGILLILLSMSRKWCVKKVDCLI